MSDPSLKVPDYVRALTINARLSWRHEWFHHAPPVITPVTELHNMFRRHVVRWGWEEYYTDIFGRVYEYNSLPYPYRRTAKEIRLIFNRTRVPYRERVVMLDYQGNINLGAVVYSVQAQTLLAHNFQSVVYLDDKQQIYTLSIDGEIEHLFDASHWIDTGVYYNYKTYPDIMEGRYRVMYHVTDQHELYCVCFSGVREIDPAWEQGPTRTGVRKVVYYGTWQFCYLTVAGDLVCYDNGFQRNEGDVCLMSGVQDAVSDGATVYILAGGSVYCTSTTKWPPPVVLIDNIPLSCTNIGVLSQDVSYNLVQVW